MNENKGYITADAEAGSVNISEEVIAAIAASAILEVDGVTAMSGNIGSDIAGMLGRKNSGKGVRVSCEEDGMKIFACVSVKYGSVITEVAKAAQQAAASAIENMTGLKVAAVNVSIDGVTFEKEASKRTV